MEQPERKRGSLFRIKSLHKLSDPQQGRIKLQKAIKKEKDIRHKTKKKIQISKLAPLSIKQRLSVELLVQKSTEEKVLLASRIFKKKNVSKFEKRILVLTKNRIITIGKRRNSIKKRICRNGHLYDLKQIEYYNSHHIRFIFRKFRIDAYTGEAEKYKGKIQKILSIITRNFPQNKKPTVFDFSENKKKNSQLVSSGLEDTKSQSSKEEDIFLFRNETKSNVFEDLDQKKNSQEEINLDEIQDYVIVDCENAKDEGEYEDEDEDEEDNENKFQSEYEYEYEYENEKENELKNSGVRSLERIYDSWCSYYNVCKNTEFLNILRKLNNSTALDLSKLNKAKDEKESKNPNISKNKKKNSVPIHYKPIIVSLQHDDYFTDLNLSNCNLKSNFEEFIQVLDGNKKITKLNLSNTGISVGGGFEKLGRVLLQNENLQHNLIDLDLSNNKMNLKADSEIYKGLKKLINLRFLKLAAVSTNSKTLNGMIELIPTFRELQLLDFSHNKFSSLNSEKLINVLSECSKTIGSKLRSLLLENTSIDLSLLSEYLKKQEKLQILHLQDNNFLKKDLWSLSETLQNLKGLKKLDISGSCTQSQYFPIILNSILMNGALRNFELIGDRNGLGAKGGLKIYQIFELNQESNSLAELSLDANQLRPAGVAHVLKACSLSRSLERISISNNILKGKGSVELYEQFVQLLTNLQTLTHFICKGNPNTKHYLGNNFLTVLKNFPLCKKLEVLDLSSNNLSDLATREFSNILINKLPALKEFFFDNNGWSLSSLKMLALNISNVDNNKAGNLIGNWPTNDANLLVLNSKKKSSKPVRQFLSQFKETFLNGLSHSDFQNDHQKFFFANKRSRSSSQFSNNYQFF
ncbi:leucine-rich repeat [Anaeramoeba flamelloides]|uniref:Leucine-rich repeat n=1 Tax=Anaeramoeba flamelloides TaxID=1746091 RepID=A0ABQ8YQF0_9EUKA|nr:leucine-rich repeat [Anaeramoeba flamelloides]